MKIAVHACAYGTQDRTALVEVYGPWSESGAEFGMTRNGQELCSTEYISRYRAAQLKTCAANPCPGCSLESDELENCVITWATYGYSAEYVSATTEQRQTIRELVVLVCEEYLDREAYYSNTGHPERLEELTLEFEV